MVVVTVTVHPNGLSPAQAAKAWYLRKKEKWKWCDIQTEVVNLNGGEPSEHCLRLAEKRMGKKGKSATLQTFRAHLAAQLGVAPSDVVLSVASGSIQISYEVRLSSAAAGTPFTSTPFPAVTIAR